jgi:hypothetical protein
MPVDYPDGKKIQAKSRQIYAFETSDAYDDVYRFYKTNLIINPLTSDDSWIGTWDEYAIRDIGVLFECASYLNSYEAELGCIFINKTNSDTVIYTIWSYNEGPGYPCYHLPGIEAEDYLDVFDSGP